MPRFFNTGNGYINTDPVTADLDVVSVNTPTAGNEIITLSEAKSYLGFSNSRKDGQVQDFINSSIARAEQYLGTDLISKEREVYYSHLREPVSFFYGPLNIVRGSDGLITNITATTERDGVTTTLVENEDYRIEGGNDPQFVLTRDTVEGLTIRYTTLGSNDVKFKAGLYALIYNYFYNDGSPQGNWMPHLSSFRRHKYYGIR